MPKKISNLKSPAKGPLRLSEARYQRQNSKPEEVEIGKTAKKTVVKKEIKVTNLSVPVYSLEGVVSDKMSLPKELFGAKINKVLLAQAIRVYANNKKAHFGSTKTRGEVKGSTRKIRVQKGTGGARHGGIRAPIFVGGGIALGPKYRKVIMDLPKKMKKAALISALSSRALSKEVLGITDLDKVSGKTKQMQNFINKLARKNALLVLAEKNEMIMRSTRNLAELETVLADQLNTWEVISHQTLLLTKEAVAKLEAKMTKKEEKK